MLKWAHNPALRPPFCQHLDSSRNHVDATTIQSESCLKDSTEGNPRSAVCRRVSIGSLAGAGARRLESPLKRSFTWSLGLGTVYRRSRREEHLKPAAEDDSEDTLTDGEEEEISEERPDQNNTAVISERYRQEDSEETLRYEDERDDRDSAMIAGNNLSTTTFSSSDSSEVETISDVKKILEELEHIKRRVIENQENYQPKAVLNCQTMSSH